MTLCALHACVLRARLRCCAACKTCAAEILVQLSLEFRISRGRSRQTPRMRIRRNGNRAAPRCQFAERRRASHAHTRARSCADEKRTSAHAIISNSIKPASNSMTSSSSCSCSWRMDVASNIGVVAAGQHTLTVLRTHSTAASQLPRTHTTRASPRSLCVRSG